ncbi:MAG: glycosyltransferase N-terminal domain-containing protein [Candidatus Aegiribacteria sp.]
MRRPDLLSLSRVLGRLFMRLIGLTWRVEYVRPFSGRSGMTRGRTVFYAFWHGRQLPLIHTHRGEGVTVLVSRNTDGQYVTNVLHSMGFRTVRGSSSRGGAEALGSMARSLRRGEDCAITPDGPRGPAKKAKAGTALISRLGGRPVVPMGTSGWPAVRFSSWDRFMLPLPFAKVVVVEGRPLRSMRRDEPQEVWLEGLETGLCGVTAYADLLSSPRAGLLSALLRAAARAVSPLARLLLLNRPERERRERKGYAGPSHDRPVWMHGSSLGELNGLLPFARGLLRRGVPVYMTCFTPSGRAFIEEQGLPGSFIPLDVPRWIERFLERTDPRALVLAETEIWPNAILGALSRRIPCVLVNGRLSKKSLRRYRLMAPLPGGMLSCFSAVLARSGEDRKRFLSLGVDPRVVTVSGDSKFMADSGDPPPEWRKLLACAGPVMVAGSTREGEEEIILSACRSAGYFPVVVPRHLDRVREVETLMKEMGFSPVRWSQLFGSGREEVVFDSVLTDVQGVLARMYGIGDAAFVGGTLAPIGGHNVLEPAMRGVPFTVGPNYGNFRDAVEKLREKGGAAVFSSSGELAAILETLAEMPPDRMELKAELRRLKGGSKDGLFRVLARAGVLEDNGKT